MRIASNTMTTSNSTRVKAFPEARRDFIGIGRGEGRGEKRRIKGKKEEKDGRDEKGMGRSGGF
jgi:hypothetical protein